MGIRITRAPLRLVAAAASGVLLLLMVAVTTSPAAVYLELDFQNNPVAGQISTSASTATTKFAVEGAATVNAGAAGPSSSNPKVATGVLSVPRPASTDENGILSAATSGNNHRYEAFVGAGSTFASSTMMTVFRPHFDGDVPANVTRFLFSHSQHGYGNGVIWTINNLGISASLGPNVGGPRVTLGKTGWDSDTWYALGISWAPNEEVHLYLRPLEPAGTASFVTSELSLTTTPSMVRPISIGQGTNSDGATVGNAAGGDFAYYLWNSDYGDSVADFNALYATLVPEPSATMVTALATVACLLRRSRRRRD